MVISIETLPEERVRTFHAFKINCVLVAFFPSGLVVIQRHEGLQIDLVVQDHRPHRANQIDSDLLMGDLLIDRKDLPASRRVS